MPSTATAADTRALHAAAREEARTVVREHVARTDAYPTGPEIGALFGRTARWGLQQIDAVRSEAPPADVPPLAPETGGNSDGTPVTGWEGTAATSIVLVVFAVSALTSYMHQAHLAHLAGEGRLSWLLPLTVDGLVFGALLTIRTLRKLGARVPGGLRLVLAFAFASSTAANVVAADPTTIGRVVAAWPPLVAFIVHEVASVLFDAIAEARKTEG